MIGAVLLAVAAHQAPELHYGVEYRRSGDSTVAVTIRLPRPIDRPTQFGIPRAIPMGYGTQPYDRFVVDLVAKDPAGRPIGVTDIDGPRWTIEASAGSPVATISYQVDLARMERQILSAGDASRARPRYLGLLGYSILGFVAGWTDVPAVLTVRVPSDWGVITTLAPTRDSTGTATVRAASYYALADAQIMAGPGLTIRRRASGAPLTVAVFAEDSVEVDVVADLADQALRKTVDYFGSAPFPHFTISLEVLRPISPDHGYRFSMEHLESATFRFATGQVDLSAAARPRFSYNLLHHIAHAWIPKRCAPAGYYPFEWDFAAPIDAIWFSEGWAQYAAVDIATRDDPNPAAARRAWGARRFDQGSVDREPPLAGRSTSELSRIASHQYSDDFRISQAVFSRGARMAEQIDERIRERTLGRKTFREVARGLMAWCATAPGPISVERIGRIVRETTGVVVDDLMVSWLAPRGGRAVDRARP